ncbi:MAG: serine hydrolase domain-containing protein [Armatimonadota bacterium]
MKPPPLPRESPEACGLARSHVGEAARLVRAAVDQGHAPGAVLLLGRRGKVAYEAAFGVAVARPNPIPTRRDTIYDLASLTKCVATGMCVAALLEEGRVRLDDPIARHLPEFADAARLPGLADRSRITVRHLAVHRAGLPAGGAYRGRRLTLREILPEIARSRVMAPPGERFLYSDFSAIVLGALVESVEGMDLHQAARRRIFSPLGMDDTGFRPGPYCAPRCASTNEERDEASSDRGRVHDPTAKALGGTAGHAGLFSTAEDLSRLCACLLAGGTLGQARILRPETVSLCTGAIDTTGGIARGLLWDIDSPYSIRAGLSPRSFGHTGFTGTSIWLDPDAEAFAILLTNAVHSRPATNGVIALRRAVSNALAMAIRDAPP